MPRPIESPPRPPHLPANYRPDESAPVPVGGKRGGSALDTWESVAKAYNMNVQELIRFNFKTITSSEVNWYLRRNVGCRVPSPSGYNWTFRDADPGVIYVPQPRIRFGYDIIEGHPGHKGSLQQQGKDLKNMFDAGGWSTMGKALDIIAATDVGAAIAGLQLPLALTAGLPLAGLAASLMALGAPHLDAFNKIKQEQVLWGFSYGVLFGIYGKKASFIQSHLFDRRPVNSRVYPHMEKEFQAAYQLGLALGYVVGNKKMNMPQKEQLAERVEGHMNLRPYPDDTSKWTEAHRHSFYIDAAAMFRKHILKL